MAAHFSSGAFFRTGAWHGLGKVLTDAPTSERMIIEAGMDWETLLKPIYCNGHKVEDYQATVRGDTGEVLGIVKGRYVPCHNAKAFEFLDSLLMDGIMKYESAGCLKGGKVIWAMAKMPTVDEIAEGDSCDRYCLFASSHDGSEGIRAIPTSTRVVCWNTLRIALAECKFPAVRHTANQDKRLENLKLWLSQFDAGFTLFRTNAQALASKQYTQAQLKDYLESLYPTPEKDGRGKTIRDNKVAKVMQNLGNERQTLDSIKGTWWSLFNAVTEHVDHQSTFKGTNKEENRFTSTVDGALAEFKEMAFANALAMAA